MNYLSSLSKTQWVWLVGTLAVCAAVLAVGWVFEPDENQAPDAPFTTAMTIKDIAPKLEVTGKSLARELGLPLDAPKGKPLKKLGVAQTDLDEATAHLLSHRPTQLRYYVFVALVLWGLVFLWRLGRPDGSPITQRKSWYPRAPYILALLAAGVVFGFWLGKSPNPMEGIVKFFKSMVGLYPSVTEKAIALAFFIALAAVGNKLVCGWACPFGALQELLYSLPILRRAKNKKIPFLISNSIRAILFAAVLLVLFGVVGGRKGTVLYHYLNPFNLFDLDFDHAPIAITIIVALGLSLIVYRPFCQFICPFGFVSWLAERLSLARVRIDPARCNQCGACVKACPLDAAKDRVAGKLFAADCYSCARCLNVCPQDAISYGLSIGGKSSGGSANGKS
ncbi:MAG: 4Fe-4S binding protein [Pirellulaceae bacterium]|nr:4Fe-4S binding protein [Pirellulaceae bacterium]